MYNTSMCKFPMCNFTGVKPYLDYETLCFYFPVTLRSISSWNILGDTIQCNSILTPHKRCLWTFLEEWNTRQWEREMSTRANTQKRQRQMAIRMQSSLSRDLDCDPCPAAYFEILISSWTFWPLYVPGCIRERENLFWQCCHEDWSQEQRQVRRLAQRA